MNDYLADCWDAIIVAMVYATVLALLLIAGCVAGIV